MRTYEDVVYKGHKLVDLAVAWFQMSNDDFFKIYGFNFNPHQYPGLYEKAREIVYPEINYLKAGGYAGE